MASNSISISSVKLLDSVTTTGAGAVHQPRKAQKTFQAFGSTSSGTGSVVVDVEFSNDKIHWVLAGTITLTLGTTEVSDGFYANAVWLHARGNVVSISGTGANVSLVMGL